MGNGVLYNTYCQQHVGDEYPRRGHFTYNIGGDPEIPSPGKQHTYICCFLLFLL